MIIGNIRFLYDNRLSIEISFLRVSVYHNLVLWIFYLLFINHENKMTDETKVEEVVATDATPETEKTEEKSSETNTEVVAE